MAVIMMLWVEASDWKWHGTQINRPLSEELGKRTSGQKQVFGFGRKREKGSDSTRRLGRITTRKCKAWERMHSAKHRDRGSGSKRPSGSLKIATMPSAHQRRCAPRLQERTERPVSQTKSTHAPLLVWPPVCILCAAAAQASHAHAHARLLDRQAQASQPSTFARDIIAPNPCTCHGPSKNRPESLCLARSLPLGRSATPIAIARRRRG